MRVVLVGTAAARRRLRNQLPDGVDVAAEYDTLATAQRDDADAYLVAPADRSDAEWLVEPLTSREAQVLELLADGKSNKMIAAALGISDETVKFHLAAIFGKLGASNRTDAVRLAIKRGLVAI